MSKIINIELLNSIRRPDEMIDELLDKQVEQIETALGNQGRGAGSVLLSLFVQNGNRVQLTQAEIINGMERRTGIHRSKVQPLLQLLQGADILRQTASGRYEMVNNFVAKRANQKVEAENRVLRTIKATIQDRLGRNELLDEQYLNYISSSLELLDLSPQEVKFIEQSRKAIRRKRALINTLLAFLFLLLAGMTVFAFRNAAKVSNQLVEVKEANDKLRIERDRTQAARDEAEKARLAAQEALGQAEKAKEEAERERNAAFEAKILADVLRRQANRDRDSIIQLQRKANERLQLVERLQREAEEKSLQNERLAEDARASAAQATQLKDRADRLNKVSTSRIAAVRSLQIEDARLRSLVALEAYNINSENPVKDGSYNPELGDVRNPEIMRALYDAARVSNPKLSYRKAGEHQGAVRDIVFHPTSDVFYTAGSDGTVKSWQIAGWERVGVPRFSAVKALETERGAAGHNCLAINPDGSRLVVAGEMPFFQVLSTKNGQLIESPDIPNKQEIFECGFFDEKGFFAAGRDYNYVWNGQRLQGTKKAQRNRANAYIKTGELRAMHGFRGVYDDFTYRMFVEVFAGGKSEVDEYTFSGPRREMDHGNVTAVAYSAAAGQESYVAYGFSTGKVMIIHSTGIVSAFAGDHRVFKLHAAGISDMAFSRDGRYLAVTGFDGKVTVWEVRHFKHPSYQPMVFGPQSGWAMSVVFSPASDYIVVGCQDGSLFFWSLDPDRYASEICESLRASIDVAQEDYKRLNTVQRKSGESSDIYYDEISRENYVQYFGEPGKLRPFQKIRTCER